MLSGFSGFYRGFPCPSSRNVIQVSFMIDTAIVEVYSVIDGISELELKFV